MNGKTLGGPEAPFPWEAKVHDLCRDCAFPMQGEIVTEEHHRSFAKWRNEFAKKLLSAYREHTGS